MSSSRATGQENRTDGFVYCLNRKQSELALNCLKEQKDVKDAFDALPPIAESKFFETSTGKLVLVLLGAAGGFYVGTHFRN